MYGRVGAPKQSVRGSARFSKILVSRPRRLRLFEAKNEAHRGGAQRSDRFKMEGLRAASTPCEAAKAGIPAAHLTAAPAEANLPRVEEDVGHHAGALACPSSGQHSR